MAGSSNPQECGPSYIFRGQAAKPIAKIATKSRSAIIELDVSRSGLKAIFVMRRVPEPRNSV